MTQVNDSSGLFQRLSGRNQPENYPVMPEDFRKWLDFEIENSFQNLHILSDNKTQIKVNILFNIFESIKLNQIFLVVSLNNN